jgi:hypothetical protein
VKKPAMLQYRITRKDNATLTAIVTEDILFAECDKLSEGQKYQLEIKPVTPIEPINSTFANLVMDETAKTRIEAQHKALTESGLTVNAGQQLYATGTRMADIGYATQKARKVEHDKKLPIRESGERLVAMVKEEKRQDVIVSAREFARAIHANGAITVHGNVIGEQAIRGLSARLESPMLSYVLGISERIAERRARPGAIDAIVTAENNADRAMIAEAMRHECMANPDARLKLRLREIGANGKPDCYAIVSEGYTTADAPEAISQLVAQLPKDARGTFAYDTDTTSWEFHAAVWTPTPVAEQAVGEAFEGYVSFQSKDNGTAKFRGGGGITLLRCLNASTYSVDDAEVAKVHRGRILFTIDRMVEKSLHAIDVLTTAWGTNRKAVIEVPAEHKGKPMTLEDAIPGFYMHMLRAAGSELSGVLVGRTNTHAEGLTRAYFAERRDKTQLVRSDLAQGWTRYIQSQPSSVRRDAEVAIGDWLVNNRPVKCEFPKRK